MNTNSTFCKCVVCYYHIITFFKRHQSKSAVLAPTGEKALLFQAFLMSFQLKSVIKNAVLASVTIRNLQVSVHLR